MRRFWLGAVAATLAVVLGASVCAQEVKCVEEKRLSLRLEKAEAAQVLSHLARAMDARLDYACDRPSLVTISFERLTPKTAFAAVCESAGLEWTLVEEPERVLHVTCGAAPASAPEGAHAVQVQVEKRVDAGSGGTSSEVALKLKDAKFEEVLKLAAELMDARLVMDSSLGDRFVSLDVEKMPMSQVLDTLCAQAGAKWILVPGTPPTLKVDAK